MQKDNPKINISKNILLHVDTMHVIYYHFRLVSDITLNKIWQVMVTQKICYGNYYREQPKDYSEGPRRFYS